MKTSEAIQFLRDAGYNYVIITNRGLPLKWSSDDEPIIYGSREDAEEDFDPNFDSEVITLREFVERESVKE